MSAQAGDFLKEEAIPFLYFGFMNKITSYLCKKYVQR